MGKQASKNIIQLNKKDNVNELKDTAYSWGYKLEDELTEKEREEYEMMVDLPNT